jgi:alginate O-acetyltransferase complex protein AlgI
MLFTSFEFILIYLPLVFAGFFLLARFAGRKWAALWLGVVSVFFYGWWNLAYVPLLLGSIIFNYFMGFIVSKYKEKPAFLALSRGMLIAAIGSNLLLLGYYKYTNFFLGELALTAGNPQPALEIVLPLGISFFTFTQIAFLVDVWRGKAHEYNFWHYLLFVTWFPHLIAGPVLHHAQMMTQFQSQETYRIRSRNLAIGFALFTVGLSKKLLLADPISAYADTVFQAATSGQVLSMLVAWAGALAYTFQIYFDFSGYSDMAVGLSLLFGIKLPINFNSPYKAPNMIEFWRRWHMTLSQFLKDYLYISLGGNRLGEVRKLVNLMLTMLLGGLWHGANWTFVLWGALHGVYLCINHLYQKVPIQFRFGRFVPKLLHNPLSVLFTFLLVVVAWIFFRANSLHTAEMMLVSMSGFVQGGDWESVFNSKATAKLIAYLIVSLSVVWSLPNAYEMLNIIEIRTKIQRKEAWRKREIIYVLAGVLCMVFFCASLASTFGVNVISPFIYFQF